ncbi:MAG: NAD(P)H-dependent oxidoreductase [Bacteroidia bacterium]|nr:NAD(P)H-dependent oxidoreductase [Bacteroidia bacterium]
MTAKKNILCIVGSAGTQSGNRILIDYIAGALQQEYHVAIFDELASLPHFNPELSVGEVPLPVVDFRNNVEQTDAVLICTPEYVFSIPSGLKNAIEWCVATTIFSGKPTALITASAHGQKGHEELQLIMKTLGADFTPNTTLLIQGIKGKTDAAKGITDETTRAEVHRLLSYFTQHIK